MPQLQLTDLTIRALKADAQTDFWDTKTPAFGIRVGKRGRTFIAKVHNRRVTLGRYPDLSLADARKQALGLKSEKRVIPNAIRFDQALELFLTNYCAVNNRARVAKERERVLRKHFSATLGKMRLNSITHEYIGPIIDALLPTPSEANHAFKEARTFFRWATKPPRRYILISPLQGMEMPVKEKKRRRILADPELLSVWRAAEGQGYPHGTIVQLLILTGQRRGEIGALQWGWINQRDRLITLPDWLTKNNVEHVFPYGDMVALILDTIPRRNSTQMLFPARGYDDKPFSGWSKSKAHLETLPPIRSWTLHDLRRTYSTRMGQLNVPQRVNDRLLNHISQGEITPLGQVYNLATYLPQMRDAIAHYETHLSQLFACH
jgi:integrase